MWIPHGPWKEAAVGQGSGSWKDLKGRGTIGYSRMSRTCGVAAPVAAEPKTSEDCEALVQRYCYRVSLAAATEVADGRLVMAHSSAA